MVLLALTYRIPAHLDLADTVVAIVWETAAGGPSKWRLVGGTLQVVVCVAWAVATLLLRWKWNLALYRCPCWVFAKVTCGGEFLCGVIGACTVARALVRPSWRMIGLVVCGRVLIGLWITLAFMIGWAVKLNGWRVSLAVFQFIN